MKRDDATPKDAFFNRSLERALHILNTFTMERTELSLGQISELRGLSKATVLRLCSTLLKFGFLRQDQTSKKYSLGLKVFELGSIVSSAFSLTRAASRYLSDLEIKLGRTIFLGILEEDELLYVDKKEGGTDGISFTSKVGRRRPPYWGMLGALLMAYLPEEEIERLLEAYPLTPTARKSYTSKEDFKAWLAQIRKQGYVVEDETAFEGIAGIAAPIRDFSGNVMAAVGVGFISSSVDAGETERIISEVTTTASLISRELGYGGVHKGRTNTRLP
jgi:IclR family transcriptional regulator, KDG regulon repressor